MECSRRIFFHAVIKSAFCLSPFLSSFSASLSPFYRRCMWETEGANTLLVSSEIALYETNSSTMSKQIGAAARCQAKSEKNPASHLHCCKVES